MPPASCLAKPRIKAIASTMLTSTVREAARLQDLGSEKPPAGTLYNYPPRGDVTALLAGYPAPTSLGAQMFAQGTICKLVAQCTQQGKSIDQAIDFARTELEGFMRT
jgi:hypothetical protein